MLSYSSLYGLHNLYRQYHLHMKVCVLEAHLDQFRILVGNASI